MTVEIKIVGESASQAISEMVDFASPLLKGVQMQVAEARLRAQQQATTASAEQHVATASAEQPAPLEGDIIPPARKRRTKAEMEAAAAAEAAKSTAVVENTASEPAAVPDIKDVRDALKALASAKGEDAVFKLLEKFNSKNASGLPEDKRAAMIAEAGELAGAQ